MSKSARLKAKAREFWLFSVPHLPSVVTLMALCTSFTSIFFALNNSISHSIICIWCGAFLDALDGRIARYFDVCSQFGAEIDSLADLVSFGVSPGVVIFLTIFLDTSQEMLGWGCVCTYVACMAVRLARFNVTHDDSVPAPEWSKMFFKGVPAPAGATVLLSPVFAKLAGVSDLCTPSFYIFWALFTAFLLVSPIRTFSGKGIKLKGRNRRLAPLVAIVPLAFFIVGLLRFPLFDLLWKGAVLGTLVYVCTFPISHMYFRNFCSSGQGKKNTTSKES